MNGHDCFCCSLKAFWFSFFLFFIVVLGHGLSESENPMVELSSGEDLMREMAGYGEERLSTVLVTGSVLCEACLHAHSLLHAWPVSGATVGVNCHKKGKKSLPSDRIHGVTDEFGDFIIDIPSHLHATPSLEKICSIKILRVPKNSRCQPVHIGKPEHVRLSSFGNGIRTYTSGILPLQHRASKPLQACKNKGTGYQQSSW